MKTNERGGPTTTDELPDPMEPSGTPARIIVGDVRAVLASLPDASVNCVVTSPPYWGLRDYGVAGQIGLEPTPDEYVAAMVGVFREVRRVLRPDGVCWVNLGDTFAGGARGAGGPSAKSTLKMDGRPESARVATIAREKSQTAQRYEASRETTGLKPKDLVGIPWRVAFALQADGWWLRSDVIWAKTAPMPESVTDRPTKAHEYVFLLTRSETYAYDADAVRESATSTGPRIDLGTQNADALLRNDTGVWHGRVGQRGDGARNLRSVWTLGPDPYPGAHFAAFPRKLAERCILAGCPEGGVVLDPFCGTGTAGAVATGTGRRFIGIELNPEYALLAKDRIGMFARIEEAA